MVKKSTSQISLKYMRELKPLILEYYYVYVKQINVGNGDKTIMIKNCILIFPDDTCY